MKRLHENFFENVFMIVQLVRMNTWRLEWMFWKDYTQQFPRVLTFRHLAGSMLRQ